MTKIRYNISAEESEITVVGHAGFDEIGKDIVCAAISILCQTLLSSVYDYTNDVDYRAEPGYMWIKAKGKHVRYPFKTIITGLKMIAQYYPAYIELERG